MKNRWKKRNFIAEKYDIADKAATRLRKLDNHQILSWSDTVGTGVAKALGDYRKLKSEESLEEAKMGVITLLVALEILQERNFTSSD